MRRDGPDPSRARPTPNRSHDRASSAITAALLRRWPLPGIDARAGKDGRGCVLVVGGSREIPGAVILAGTAALRAGAGKLQIATHRELAPLVAVALPEARVVGLRHARDGELAPQSSRAIRAEIDACDSLLIGPGMTSPGPTVDLLRRRAGSASGPTLIVDAGALDVFKRRGSLARDYPPGAVATPHAGEMANLWNVSRDQVVADPLPIARQAARELGVVVVLKGARTHVGVPDGRVFHSTNGNGGLGTSGSGDVLAGIIAGLCARGATPVQAAIWGVFVHGMAGDVLRRQIGSLGYLAHELSAEVPRLLDRLQPRTTATAAAAAGTGAAAPPGIGPRGRSPRTRSDQPQKLKLAL